MTASTGNGPVVNGVSVYHDVQGLAQLRADAATKAPEAAREAARQFEALFVQMMLKSMRDANAALGDGGDNTYQQMFDQQIALEMTRGKGLGLADMLVRQLQMAGVGSGEGQAGGVPLTLPTPGSDPMGTLFSRSPAESGLRAASLLSALKPVPSSTALDGLGMPDLAALMSPGTPGARQDFRPAGPREFVQAVWPHAEAVARELQVDPRAIVAQAALETGWGQRLIRDEAGVSGNNLFGIKADSRWQGSRVTVQTLEYEGGVPVPQRAQFRAYPTLAEGFADYARFLKDNPRYTEALRHGANPGRYAEKLQAAGYATDPRYAAKIQDILASPTLKEAVAPLKAGAEMPNYF